MGCCILLGCRSLLRGKLQVGQKNASVPEADWAVCTQLANSPLMVSAPGLRGVDFDAGEPWVGRGLAVSLEATHPWLGNVGGVLGGAPIRPRATSGECSTRGKAHASESISEESDNLSPPTYVVMTPPTYVIMFPLTYVVGFEKTFSKIQNGRYKQKNSQHNLAHQNKYTKKTSSVIRDVYSGSRIWLFPIPDHTGSFFCILVLVG